jgi:hypothetical protein
MKVTPGSHFDGIVQFALNWKGLTVDLGYNLFAKRTENVRMKVDPCACSDTSCTSGVDNPNWWYNNTYALTSASWDPNAAAFTANDTYPSSSDWINREHLCIDACTNPSVVTHKIYGGVGYAFNDMEYPVMLGLGGSYEWETDNDCLEQWALWAKVGVTF